MLDIEVRVLGGDSVQASASLFAVSLSLSLSLSLYVCLLCLSSACACGIQLLTHCAWPLSRMHVAFAIQHRSFGFL